MNSSQRERLIILLCFSQVPDQSGERERENSLTFLRSTGLVDSIRGILGFEGGSASNSAAASFRNREHLQVNVIFSLELFFHRLGNRLEMAVIVDQRQAAVRSAMQKRGK